MSDPISLAPDCRLLNGPLGHTIVKDESAASAINLTRQENGNIGITVTARTGVGAAMDLPPEAALKLAELLKNMSES